jgi:hypothetical protein
MITLTERLDDYIAVRRSLGYDLSFAARVLRGLTRTSKSRDRQSRLVPKAFVRR